ncbi:ATP-binding protein [Haloarcula salinisoli]|uniref:PAS domain-containing protein n=1 Tax=Haloarcula salinisoli TaxID=2487746 RepID=A0A8J7YF24_9EURY|nr:ATP-binding protein [Halomicroarcula salinisoli]MBX0304307.1 PAS domain-containing protein [Halomicroarcula salinisoli]
MFFLDEDLRITRIAGTLAEWLDQGHEALLGEPVTAVVAEADVGALQTALSQVIDTQTSQTVTCRFEVAGETIPVRIELAPVAPESTLGTVIGTVHRETIPEERPSAQLVRLRNFIELLDDAAVVYELVDGEPLVQAVNSAFEGTFGYQPEFIVGESLNDYIVPAEYQTEAARFDEQVADGNVTTELVRRQTTNGVQEFSYRGLPIDRTEGHLYGLAIYADMTETQHARQHLHVLHRVLRHNVRNDLTVILGMAEQIADKGTTTEVTDAASRIISHAEDLAGVSEKARMAENMLGESPSDTIVEIGGVATEVVADARRKWHDATIETDIETPVPVSTGLEIRDALENLVENAVTHNTGSPTVRVSTRTETPIHATTRATGQNVVITIEDDGPGIPEYEQAVIFDGADVTQLKHGSGLGLWVVRWIVESADGTVSYDRSDGWTTITLRLPLATDVGDTHENGQVNSDSR